MRIRSERAFTLFELLITIAIIGIIMGVVVSQMGDVLELNMRTTSNKLASTIRYLYNKSATDQLYMRLIFDLDERTYWVEATSDPLRVSKAGEELEVGGPKGKEEEDVEESEGGLKEGEAPKIKYPKPSFGQVDSFLLKPTKISESVFIKDVFVEHRPAAVEGGKVAIYFFPNGYVEHAIINLTNEEEDYFYSLETNPVSGKVKIENEYRTMEGK